MRRIILTEQTLKATEVLVDLKKLTPQILKYAQKTYDNWIKDGNVGICDDIARSIVFIVDHETEYNGFLYYNDGHFSCRVIVCDYKLLFNIDIPYSYYEEGRDHVFFKIPNVVFTENMIQITDISEQFDKIVSDYCNQIKN